MFSNEANENCLCVCVYTLQAGNMESPFPQTTSLGPGSLRRRCTTFTAGEGWFDLARELLSLQEHLWRSVLLCVYCDIICMLRPYTFVLYRKVSLQNTILILVYFSLTEAGPR